MALIIVISTGDFQIRWNVLSLSFSERESGKWPLGLSDFHHKGGFPVMAETTRNHIFSKEISQVIIAAMVLGQFSLKKLSASDFSYERTSALSVLSVVIVFSTQERYSFATPN